MVFLSAIVVNQSSLLAVRQLKDNASFADVTGGAFTAITGTGSERIAPTGTINRYVRLVVTVTSGSATFQVSFSPNKK